MFPLDAELVIEGMEGALDCQDYLFHVHRGYGSVKWSYGKLTALNNRSRLFQTYNTDAESEEIKGKILREYERGKRRKQRDSLRGVNAGKTPVKTKVRWWELAEQWDTKSLTAQTDRKSGRKSIKRTELSRKGNPMK